MKGFIRSILAAAFLVLVSRTGVQQAKAAEVKDGVRIERDISYLPEGDSSQRPRPGAQLPVQILSAELLRARSWHYSQIRSSLQLL